MVSVWLQACNVEMRDGSKINFDFLGKDSVRYENLVDVPPEVWNNMKAFKEKTADGKRKPGEDNLFDAMDAQVRLALLLFVAGAASCKCL